MKGESVWQYSRLKNAFLDYQKKELKKVKKVAFYQTGQSKNGDFSISFLAIQARKMSLLGYTNKKFKKSKNGHFSKGVNPWLWSKNGNYSNFFLAIQTRTMSFTIFQNEKTPFQAMKIKSLNNSKIHIFPKGLTHGFSTKMAIFNLFFGNIGEENVFNDILERKNAFLGDKNKKF